MKSDDKKCTRSQCWSEGECSESQWEARTRKEFGGTGDGVRHSPLHRRPVANCCCCENDPAANLISRGPPACQQLSFIFVASRWLVDWNSIWNTLARNFEMSDLIQTPCSIHLEFRKKVTHFSVAQVARDWMNSSSTHCVRLAEDCRSTWRQEKERPCAACILQILHSPVKHDFCFDLGRTRTMSAHRKRTPETEFWSPLSLSLQAIMSTRWLALTKRIWFQFAVCQLLIKNSLNCV